MSSLLHRCYPETTIALNNNNNNNTLLIVLLFILAILIISIFIEDVMSNE